MRTIKIIRLVVLLLVLSALFTSTAAYAAVATPGGPAASPGSTIQNVLGQKDDGQIKNVTISPSNHPWYWGIPVHVQWEWPNNTGSQADVTLWSGSTQVAVIVSGWSGTSVGWEVPFNIAPGYYTVRVQSSKNNKNFGEAAVRIENSALTVTSPKGIHLGTGVTYPITWTYTGNPGPLKIELTDVAGGSSLMIADNVPIGSSGTGKIDWKVFDNLATKNNYVIKLTSMTHPTITATGTPIAIWQPIIALYEPPGGRTYQPGTKVTIKWNSIGNLGPTVKITVTPVGSSSPVLDVENYSIGSLGPENFNHGSYDWTPPGLTVNQQYIIRVESTQNPKIFGQLAAPITVMAQNPYLDTAFATFSTKNENKDHDTTISVQVKKINRVLANADGAAGNTPFTPNSTNYVPLFRTGAYIKSDCEGPWTVRVGQTPVGNDKWSFTVKITLTFSDGSKIERESSQISTLDGRQTIDITM